MRGPGGVDMAEFGRYVNTSDIFYPINQLVEDATVIEIDVQSL